MAGTKRKAASCAVFAEPVLRTTCGGVPVHACGYTHLLGESPEQGHSESGWATESDFT